MSTPDPATRRPGKGPSGRRRRPARLWHRWIGGIILVPLLFVAVTGVLLNHTTELGWDERRTDSRWILKRYGMELEGEPVNFDAGNGNFASTWGENLFWNGTMLEASGKLLGAVPLEESHALILDQGILLLASDGTLIEQLGEESLPPLPLTRAGVGPASNGALVVTSADGSQSTFSSDLLTFEDSTATEGEIAWCTDVGMTASSLRSKMETAYRGDGIPWSRVLLDMHSGRFFGEAGRWIADFVVLLLVVLSLTGLRLMLRPRRPTEGTRRTKNT